MKQHLVYPLRLLLALGALCHCSGETPSPSMGTPAAAGSPAGDDMENGAMPEDRLRQDYGL